jgi:hypothetical protein
LNSCWECRVLLIVFRIERLKFFLDAIEHGLVEIKICN